MNCGDRVRLRAPERFTGHEACIPPCFGTIRGFGMIYRPCDVEDPDAQDVLVEWDSGTPEPSYYPPEHLIACGGGR